MSCQIWRRSINFPCTLKCKKHRQIQILNFQISNYWVAHMALEVKKSMLYFTSKHRATSKEKRASHISNPRPRKKVMGALSPGRLQKILIKPGRPLPGRCMGFTLNTFIPSNMHWWTRENLTYWSLTCQRVHFRDCLRYFGTIFVGSTSTINMGHL